MLHKVGLRLQQVILTGEETPKCEGQNGQWQSARSKRRTTCEPNRIKYTHKIYKRVVSKIVTSEEIAILGQTVQ